MKKKIGKIIKASFVAILLCYPFLYFTDWFFIKVFNFDYLVVSDWKKISVFWQKGGIIKVWQDYVFLACLFSLPLFFIFLLRFFTKFNYLNLLLFPISYYNNYIISRYGDGSKRIILRNLGRSKKISEKLEEIGKPNIEESKKQSQNIRLALQEKLTNLKK